MNQRRPRTALRSSALPSLGALIATGVVVFDGCGPQDGSVARGDRLSSHGHNAARDLGNGRFGDALREVGMGLGLIDAPAPVDVAPAGAMPVVNPQPPPPPEQPLAPSGGVAPVLPQPPPEQQPHPAGGPMNVDPTPAPPPPAPPPLSGHGNSRMEIGGAVRAVPPTLPTGPSSSPRR